MANPWRSLRVKDLTLLLIFFVFCIVLWSAFRSGEEQQKPQDWLSLLKQSAAPEQAPQQGADFPHGDLPGPTSLRQIPTKIPDLSFACPPCPAMPAANGQHDETFQAVQPATNLEFLALRKWNEERQRAKMLVIHDADIAVRNESVYSVTLKQQTAPSGDKHDYLSLAKYFWPDPSKQDGLPYIGRDGHINPEVETVRDYRLLRQMMREVGVMGQAYFWTGDAKYAKKACYRLNEWFLHPETKMNPNLKYASFRKGTEEGRRTGVLDLMQVYRMFDGIKYLQASEYYTKELHEGLQNWFIEYYDWFYNSKQGKLERNAHNNHGTYYDVQHIALLRFLGRVEEARAVAEEAKTKRILRQVKPNGWQPGETERPTGWFYSAFNLQGLMLLAQQAKLVQVDLWNYEGPNGESIKKAVDYLLPYALTEGEGWPYKNIKGFDIEEFYKVLRVSYLVYGDPTHLQGLETLAERRMKENKRKGMKPPNDYICDLGIITNGHMWNCW
ncbi:uncharacterized protein VTP21DRAFT_9229 [Calcarisporiella thermophila]|uniref:uncharacterized protein n=1 Tax=Calcarisporiella thermophila TaxID=911321 RepID=UPI003742EF8F